MQAAKASKKEPKPKEEDVDVVCVQARSSLAVWQDFVDHLDPLPEEHKQEARFAPTRLAKASSPISFRSLIAV